MENLIVDTELTLVEYLVLVSDLADSYFDENGEYKPQFGMINVARQFYNYCVKDCEIKKQYGDSIIDAVDIVELVTELDFMQELNNAIKQYDIIGFDFANAYTTALDIVETKRSTFTYMIDAIKKYIFKVLATLEDTFNEETLNKISEIAAKADNAGDFATALVESYGKSQRFQDIITSDVKEENIKK